MSFESSVRDGAWHASARVEIDALYRWLWGAALLFYGAGDLVSTFAGLWYGAEEANPFPAAMIAATSGFAETVVVLIVWKAAVLIVFALLARRLSRPYDLVVPACLAPIGVVVVGWNSFVLLALFA